MTYPYTEVVYQRAGGTEYVVSNPVKGAAIQPEDWLPTDDAVVYEVW